MIAGADVQPATSAGTHAKRDYLSYTQLTTFQRCPLRWHFEYVEQRPREHVLASLKFGQALHAALECHYRAELAGLATPSLAELLTAFDQSWGADPHTAIRFTRGDTPARLRDQAARLITTFQAAPLSRPTGAILGIEEEFRRPLIPGLPDLLGRVDLLLARDRQLIVQDFKTAQRAWHAGELVYQAPQLELYSALVSPLARELGFAEVRLEFVVLTRSRRPSITVHALVPQPARLARLRRVITHVWRAMRGGHVYPNPSPMHCTTCPFQRACRAWCG